LGKNGSSFFLEGTEATARQAADATVQILIFSKQTEKRFEPGRKAASSLAVHEYLQAHPLTKIGPAAKTLQTIYPHRHECPRKHSPKLKIAKESHPANAEIVCLRIPVSTHLE